MLQAGDKAPDFTLSDSDGNNISLGDFKGKKVVLFFYPKDDTPGCTQEACDFRDRYTVFSEKNAVILGISKDGSKSHVKFRDKFNLPFILLSDENTEVMQKYDVWKEKSMYGKKYMGAIRTTFIIDEKGIIEKVYKNVKVKDHAEEVLSAI